MILIFFNISNTFLTDNQIKVYNDEFSHINIARNIYEEGIYSTCNYISNNVCNIYGFNVWKPGHHLLLSYFFKFDQNFLEMSFLFNLFMGTISIALFFFLQYIWTKKSNLALVGALILSLTPIIHLFSSSASVEISSMVFILLSLITFEIFLKEEKKNNHNNLMLSLFLFVLVYTIYLRTEFIFIIAFFIFSYIYIDVRISIFPRKE